MRYQSRPARYQTHIPVVVTHSNGAQTGCIIDINAFGACIEGVKDMGVGHKVHLRGEIENNIASVRWATDDRIGVYFERVIPPQHVAQLRFQEPAVVYARAVAGAPMTEKRVYQGR